MKTLTTLICIACIMTNSTKAQDQELPYHQIPDYPEAYTANNVAAASGRRTRLSLLLGDQGFEGRGPFI